MELRDFWRWLTSPFVICSVIVKSSMYFCILIPHSATTIGFTSKIKKDNRTKQTEEDKGKGHPNCVLVQDYIIYYRCTAYMRHIHWSVG